MIINGLGFTNRRLYLMPQFFENKPVEKLIAEGLTPEDITYDTLAATLDDIWEYGESKLYGKVALDIALDNELLGTLNHLDTTSVSVQGDYNVPDEPGVVKLTHGHSKDHRPDLKQLLISLVVTGDSRFPLWMEALDGNSSDKVNFHETLGRVKTFQEQMKYQSTAKWVADSALYTKEKLSKTEDYLWLTQVPETLTEAQRLVTKAPDSIVWTD
jgi:transposase